MLKMDKAIQENHIDARLILQVHDELVFEVKEGSEEKLAELTEEVMEGAVELRVPLKVGISVAKHG
jgi:DNA polymerase-1